MTPDEFRRMALDLPGSSEQAHMSHPDFRVGGKIFATLGCPEEGWAMVKLTPEQQTAFLRAEPHVFEPVNGAWGRRGCTYVCLGAATEPTIWNALIAAWRNTAPKRLAQQFKDQS